MQRTGGLRPAYRLIKQGLWASQPHQRQRGYAAGRRQKERVIDPSRSQTVQSFEVPLAVLDLDAEDNPYVRSYTEEDHEEQVALWNQNPDFDALADRMEGFRVDLRKREKLWRAKLTDFDARRITERDVLQIALLGSPKREVASQNSIAADEAPSPSQDSDAKTDHELLSRDTLRSIGLPDMIIDDDQQIIQVLLHRLRLQAKTAEANAKSAEETPIKVRRDRFNQALNGKDFSTIRRIVAPFLQDPTGAKIVGGVQSKLERALNSESSQVKEEETSRAAILLDNLAVNLASRGIWATAREPRMMATMERLKENHNGKIAEAGSASDR